MYTTAKTFAEGVFGKKARIDREYPWCNFHDDETPAVLAIIGEEDSMGFETVGYCQKCADERIKFLETVFEDLTLGGIDSCDHCFMEKPLFTSLILSSGVKAVSEEFTNYRDVEDGSVSHLCQVCVKIKRDADKDLMDDEDDQEWEGSTGGEDDEWNGSDGQGE